MRARFCFSVFHPRLRALTDEMEKSLSEIAIAFGHSFSMKLLPLSQAGDMLGDEQAVVVVLGGSLMETARQLGCFAVESVFHAGDEETPMGILTPAADEYEGMLRLSAYAGQKGLPMPFRDEEEAAEALYRMLTRQVKGTLVGSVTAGYFFRSALRAAAEGWGGRAYDRLLTGRQPAYFLDGRDGSPYPLYDALADALQNVLGLHKEATCLRTTVSNVIQAGQAEGGRPASLSGICGRVNEQLTLVGEMMNRDMIR